MPGTMLIAAGSPAKDGWPGAPHSCPLSIRQSAGYRQARRRLVPTSRRQAPRRRRSAHECQRADRCWCRLLG